MNEQVFNTIKEFDALPSTEEQEAIKRRYLTDEIGNFEFFSQASRYIESLKENK